MSLGASSPSFDHRRRCRGLREGALLKSDAIFILWSTFNWAALKSAGLSGIRGAGSRLRGLGVGGDSGLSWRLGEAILCCPDCQLMNTAPWPCLR